jgi:hypothetical protein
MTVATTAREVPKDMIRLALRHLWDKHPEAFDLTREDRQRIVTFDQDHEKWSAYCLLCPVSPPT